MVVCPSQRQPTLDMVSTLQTNAASGRLRTLKGISSWAGEVSQPVSSFGKPSPKATGRASSTAISGKSTEPYYLTLNTRPSAKAPALRLILSASTTPSDSGQARKVPLCPRQRLARLVRKTLSFSKSDHMHLICLHRFLVRYNLEVIRD